MTTGTTPRHSSKHLRPAAIWAALLSAAVALPAFGQPGRFGAGDPGSAGQPFRRAPSPVRRSAPSLGGVKASVPETNKPVTRATQQRDPAFRPMRVGPFPGVDNTPVVPRTRPGVRNDTFDGRFDGRFDDRFDRGFNNRFDGRFSDSPRRNHFGDPRFFRGDSVFHSGSGLNIHGAFSDDNFRIRFHTGSSLFPHLKHPVVVVPVWGGSGYWYDNDYDDYLRQNQLIQGVYTTPMPQTQPQPAPQPMTETIQPSDDKQLGEVYLLAGDSQAAANAFRSFLDKNPGDAHAMRALGLSLLDMAQVKEAAALIGMAYATNPALADEPVPQMSFGGNPANLRENLRRASIYANQSKSASAWLTVAVLMQAEGRGANARIMIQRAKEAGLDPALATRLQSALVS